MLINLRNREGKLIVKDVLDIDFDMSVEEENNKTTESAKIIEDILVAEKNKASRYEKAIIKKFEEEL